MKAVSASPSAFAAVSTAWPLSFPGQHPLPRRGGVGSHALDHHERMIPIPSGEKSIRHGQSDPVFA